MKDFIKMLKIIIPAISIIIGLIEFSLFMPNLGGNREAEALCHKIEGTWCTKDKIEKYEFFSQDNGGSTAFRCKSEILNLDAKTVERGYYTYNTVKGKQLVLTFTDDKFNPTDGSKTFDFTFENDIIKLTSADGSIKVLYRAEAAQAAG